MSKKALYQQFCEEVPHVPVYMQNWWLDQVCKQGTWDVAIVEKGGEIFGVLPFYLTRSMGQRIIRMPPLTKFMGPLLRYPPDQKNYSRLSWEKEIMQELIGRLPPFDLFFQNWYYDQKNWLPFYWKDFKQTTNYSYYIPAGTSEKDRINNYESALRRRLRKGQSEGVEIILADQPDEFLRLSQKTFARKKMQLPFAPEIIKNLFRVARERNCGEIYMARYKNQIIAAGFFVLDRNDCYYVAGGIDESFKHLGAMDLLLDHAIDATLKKGLNFDFEGSMNESIETYFRRFGALQRPYFTIYKVRSPLLRLVLTFRKTNYF